MDPDDNVILIVLCLVGLYFYSNQTLGKNNRIEKKYGSINNPSEGEEDEKVPNGLSLGSMTFQGHSPSALRVWYA
jgi:hypothetical protein